MLKKCFIFSPTKVRYKTIISKLAKMSLRQEVKNGIASLQKLDEICVIIGKETNLRYH